MSFLEDIGALLQSIGTATRAQSAAIQAQIFIQVLALKKSLGIEPSPEELQALNELGRALAKTILAQLTEPAQGREEEQFREGVSTDL